MATIIPVGKLHLAIVDDEDLNYLSQWEWKISSGGYAVSTQREADGKLKNIFMHRIVNKTPERLLCDHINGNRLDNRKCNLRAATPAQNAKNLHGAWGKIEYKGVTKLTNTRRYRATIRVNGETINLGWFRTPYEAAIAYNTVAEKLHGEFASLNPDVPTDPDWQSRRLPSASTFINTLEAYLERHPEYRKDFPRY